MPTIKDALDIIGKLTVAEQESLKTMLLSPAFVKSLNIEDFVAKERFANGRVCPLCGCIHVVRNGHRKDGTQRYVCVPCAVNRNGLSISKITNTGRVSTRDLHHIYDGRIKTNSTLVTDKMNSYVRFTNANGIDLVQLKTGKAKKGIYNIQHINSYHSQLKRFMRGFNGVSTKYLNNYLVWNNLVNYAKESDMEKRNIFLTFVLATLKTAKCRDLSNRPAVPLVA